MNFCINALLISINKINYYHFSVTFEYQLKQNNLKIKLKKNSNRTDLLHAMQEVYQLS
jgi:hypothetical protein